MKVVIYQDRRGEWRWSLKAKNGRIVADGAEGYKTWVQSIKVGEDSTWFVKAKLLPQPGDRINR